MAEQLDCAIVARESLGKIVGAKDVSEIRDQLDKLTSKVKVYSFYDSKEFELEAVNIVLDGLSTRCPSEYFDDDTFAGNSPNCDILVSLERDAKGGFYAKFNFTNKLGKSKSPSDPFHVIVSRHQKVVIFADRNRPDIVEKFDTGTAA